MSKDTLRLMARLRAADPAAGEPGLDSAASQRMVSQILAREATDTSPVGEPAYVAAKPKKLRRLVVVGVAATAIAAVAFTLPLITIGDEPLPGVPSQQANAEAAAVLIAAADKAITTTPDPAIRPDQYWKITTRELGRASSDGKSPFIAVTVHEFDNYLPADPSRASWNVYRPVDVKVLSGSVPQEILLHDDRSPIVYPPRSEGHWGALTPEFLAGVPRDVAQLRKLLYRDTKGTGQSRDGAIVVTIADALRSGRVPADLRAALYRVLATVPGVTITDHSATVDGAKGIAIGRFEAVSGIRQEIVINPANGEFIGERNVPTQVTDTNFITYSTVSRSVVDTIPAQVLEGPHTISKIDPENGNGIEEEVTCQPGTTKLDGTCG